MWRFDKNEWKERGTGEVKLLEHKETKKIRVLMRREKTLKICANHYGLFFFFVSSFFLEDCEKASLLTKLPVDPSMELKEHSGSARAWIYTAPADFADGEAKAEVFAIRFADADIAKNWKAEFDKAREHMKSLSG